jgi:hypothetical protein
MMFSAKARRLLLAGGKSGCSLLQFAGFQVLSSKSANWDFEKTEVLFDRGI